MTITRGYAYGAQLAMHTFPDGNPNVEALEASHVEFATCGHYYHTTDRVVIMTAGSYGGDILDESNSVTLEIMSEAWIDDERNARDAIDRHYGMGDYVAVCVDPLEIDDELLAEMIEVAEGYEAYPVLDESDYSNREWEAWCESLEWETRDIPESQRAAVSDWVSQHYSGYSDPGYVDREWVALALIHLGYTRKHRRIRTMAFTNGPGWSVYRYQAQVLFETESGEWEFRDLRSIYIGNDGKPRIDYGSLTAHR